MSAPLAWAEPGTWSHWTRARVYEAGWWGTDEARRVADKRRGKTWAESMGMRVPTTIDLGRCVVKPAQGSGCHGVTVIVNPRDWVIEELLSDVDGRCPPRDIRFYCFGGEALFVETCWHDFSRRKKLVNVRYYWLHDGSVADVDAVHRPDGRPLDVSLADLLEMRAAAESLAGEFELPFLRVDLYLTPAGICFGELCATPGLVMGRWIRPEWDRWFGDVLNRTGRVGE